MLPTSAGFGLRLRTPRFVPVLTIGGTLFLLSTAHAGTYTVTNTLNSGDGSLRAAIEAANADPGSTINFNIPSSDPRYFGGKPRIELFESLPAISADGTVLNADNGAAPYAPRVTLREGVNYPNLPVGLEITAANILVKGFIIGSFDKGIYIHGPNANGVTIDGCRIGIDTNPLPNGEGIVVEDAPNAVIGDSLANEIGSNLGAGVAIRGAGATGIKIRRNYIGVNAARSKYPNQTGVVIEGAPGVQIGGFAAWGAFKNYIAGNKDDGIRVSNADGTIIQANEIGFAASSIVGNGRHGINLVNANQSVIGLPSNATALGTTLASNIISHNGTPGTFPIPAGVYVASGVGNTIRANSIHSNVGPGIDLVGISSNDALDVDSGANNGQNTPALTRVWATQELLTAASKHYLQGTLTSTPNRTFALDFFADSGTPGGGIEGRTPILSTGPGGNYPHVTTDANGNASFNFQLSSLPWGGSFTATATDTVTGDTSEFVIYAKDVTPPTLTAQTPVPNTFVRTLDSIVGRYADGATESGIRNVVYSIKRVSDGLYWNNGVWSTTKQEILASIDAAPNGSGFWIKSSGNPPMSALTDGPYEISAVGKDWSGNVGTLTYEVKVDLTAPVTAASITGTGGSRTVTLNATDNYSGVKSTFYKIDGGALLTYTGPFDVTGHGDHTIQFWSQDNGGLNESAKTVSFTIDAVAPSTTLTKTGPYGPDSWFTGDGFAVLYSTESGTSYYRIDGGDVQTYTGPIPINQEGIHSIEYWSVDASGNEETHKTDSLKRDTVKPVTILTGLADRGQYKTSKTFELAATDATSGVAETYYTLDTGPAQLYTGPVTVEAEGAHVLEIWSRDVAGNEEVHQTVRFTIDATAPVTITSIEGNQGRNGWYTGPVTVQLTLTEGDLSQPTPGGAIVVNLDGQQMVYAGVVSPPGAPVIPLVVPLEITGDGTHTLTFYGSDNLDNQEAQRTLAIKIDETVPAISIDSTPAHSESGWYNAPVAYGISAVDATSGLASLSPASPLGFTSEGRSQYKIISASDYAGNTTEQFVGPINLDFTAPVTTASLSGSGSSSGAQTGDVTITLSAADALSGVVKTYYKIDGGEAQEYTTPFTVSADGSHTVTYWSVDRAGNVEGEKQRIFVIDTTAPEVTASASGTQGENGWYTGPVSVALTASDAGTGVANIYFSLNGSAPAVYSQAVAINTDGTHTLEFWAVDQAGNESAKETLSIKVDQSVPEVNFGTVTPAANAAGWNTGDVEIPFSATDVTSGVATATPGSPVRINGEGRDLTTEVTAKDVAGHSATYTSPAVNIDRTAPVTSSTQNGTTVTLSGTDALSGIAATRYKVDSGAEQNYSAPINVTGDGDHTVAFWSQDVAGNQEAAKSVSVRVDSTAPVSTATVTGTSGDNGWYRGAVSVTLAATDNVSGVAGRFYRLNGGAQTTYSAPISITANGTHTVEYWSRDAFGNEEVHRTLTIKVDTGLPTLTATVSPASLRNNNRYNNHTVSGTLTDALSSPATGLIWSVADEYATVQPSGTATVAANGSFSFVISLQGTKDKKDSARVYTITLVGKDKAGNSVTRTVTVNIT